MQNKTIVIGGAGAIGKNLVSFLLEKEHEVLVIDNLSSGSWNNLSPKSSFIHCDISDKSKIEDLIISYNPNYIYNLAAHFANQNSVDYPYEDIKTNILGQVNVLEACKKVKNLKKYIYASSSCVYGHLETMNEECGIYPYETPYAINKFTAELYTKYYAEQFSIPTVSVRIFNTFGEGELAGKYRNVIPNFIDLALKGEDIKITGDGSETRDFTYALDTVNCLVLAGEAKFNQGEVFNSGTGIDTKIIDLANMVISLTNSSSNVVFVGKRSWDGVKNRKSDVSKSEKLLGYKPNFTVEQGLLKTISWYQCQTS